MLIPLEIDEQIGGLKAKARFSEDECAPLVYLVHGRAGDYNVMWAFRRTIPDHWNIIAPQAPLEDINGGWSWWQIKPELAPRSECIAASEKFLNFTNGVEAHYGLRPQLRLAIGFSQGSVLVGLAAQARPELFSGVGILAGFVEEHSNNYLPTAAHKPNFFMAHGITDDTIPYMRALASKSLLESWGLKVQFYEDSVGHKIGPAGMRGLKEWVQAASPGN